MSGEHSSDLVEQATSLTFDEALVRVSAAIARAGLSIFAKIDHASAAGEIGMAMPPATVLIYGNPKGGTPIMLASPVAALDLPLRVLVREDAEGGVMVAFHPARPMLQKAGVPEALVARLDPAQNIILEALSS